MANKNNIVIRIEEKIRNDLKGRKKYKRETYSEIIERLLNKDRKKALRSLTE